jgi:hypothetical protein
MGDAWARRVDHLHLRRLSGNAFQEPMMPRDTSPAPPRPEQDAGNTEAPPATDAKPVTQATVPVNPADTPIGKPGENLEERLDEAIQESFPASDPVSTHIE